MACIITDNINKIVLFASTKKKGQIFFCAFSFMWQKGVPFPISLTSGLGPYPPPRTTEKGLFIMQFKRRKKNCLRLNCVGPPPHSYAEVVPLVPQDMTVFGDRALKK